MNCHFGLNVSFMVNLKLHLVMFGYTSFYIDYLVEVIFLIFPVLSVITKVFSISGFENLTSLEYSMN